MMRSTSNVRRMAATLVAGILVLGGCSGDGGADSEGSAPAASGDAEEDADASDDDAGADDSDETDPAGDDGEQADTAADTNLEDLVPPGVVGESNLGSSGTRYSSEAPFEDLVAHYESIVGEANFVNPDEVAATWVGEVDSMSISVNLSPGEGALVDVFVAERG